jgi:hypothetical protein
MPDIVRCVALLYTPVMAVVSRVWDSADDCVGHETLTELRDQLWAPTSMTRARPEG